MSGSNLTRKLIELSRGKVVLEFGAGGSTITFSESAKFIYSIESDKVYVSQLKKLFKLREITNVQLEHVNIGPTKSLGYPIRFLNSVYRKKYPNYSTFPFWNLQNLENEILVFVDGRFRVSCALQAAISLPLPFTLVFDDYLNRDEYHVIEKYIGRPSEIVNEAAIFEVVEVYRTINFEEEANFLSYDPH